MILQVLNPESPGDPTAQGTVRNAGKGSSEKSGGLYGPLSFSMLSLPNTLKIYGELQLLQLLINLEGMQFRNSVSRIELNLQPKTVLSSLPSKPDRKHDTMS